MVYITQYKDGRILARQNITLLVGGGTNPAAGSGKVLTPPSDRVAFSELRQVEEAWVRLTVVPATADPGHESDVTATTNVVGISVAGISPLFSGATVTGQVFAVGFALALGLRRKLRAL